MDRQERDGVLATDPCRVELLGGVVLLEKREVPEKRLERRAATERAPVLRQVEEAVQVEPRGEAGRGRHRFDLGPAVDGVDDVADQLDERGSLGGRQQTPIRVPESGEPLPGNVGQVRDLVEPVDGFEQRVAQLGIGVVGRGAAANPCRQGDEIAETEPVPGAEQDAHQRRGVLGRSQDPEPGVDVRHFRDRQQSPQRRDFERDLCLVEGISHQRHVAVLAEQDTDVAPGDTLLVVEAADLAGDPGRFVPRGAEPSACELVAFGPGGPERRLRGGVEQVADVVGETEDAAAGAAIERERQGRCGLPVCGREVAGEAGEVLQ